MMQFMITLRDVVGQRFDGHLAPVFRYLAIPSGATPSPAHEIDQKLWVGQVMTTFRAAEVNDLVFFVHGYNQGIDDVAAQQGMIIDGLARAGLSCTVIAFDWPSTKDTFTYLPQVDVAKVSAISLVNAAIRPFLATQTDDCKIAVHAICHSMGAFLLREAFDHADDGLTTGSDWAVNQLLIVAGDVEADDFVEGNKNTDSMLDHCYRLTNYFNKYDEVLQISNAKRLGVEPRLGRVGLPPNAPAKTANVDCSAHFQSVKAAMGGGLIQSAELSHGWYFSDDTFYIDAAATIRGLIDRSVIGTRTLPVGGTQALV
jgi:esterase/lipase superfamily enzyme